LWRSSAPSLLLTDAEIMVVEVVYLLLCKNMGISSDHKVICRELCQTVFISQPGGIRNPAWLCPKARGYAQKPVSTFSNI
jgi:hypothetical protein